VVAEGTACNPALACRSHVEHSYLLSSSGCRLDLDAQQAHGPPPVHSADFRRFHRNAPRPAAAACLLSLVVSVELGWFAAALLLVVLGIVGSVVPLMPGLPLVLGGVYLYAFGTGLHGGIGPGHLVLYTLIGGGAIALSTLANMVGVRAASGSRLAMLGATLGLVAGLFLGGPVGLLVGPFVGAVVFELLGGRASRQALRSGVGAAVGLLVGRIAEFAVAIGLSASFVVSVVRA